MLSKWHALACGFALSAASILAACGSDAESSTPAHKSFKTSVVADFDEPWAMAFLPDGRLLVTEKKGRLKVYQPGSKAVEITGVPKVAYGGQGGLGDVALHPKFAENGLVYLSYAEAGEGDLRGAAVARGKLTLNQDSGGSLSGMQVIWRQVPKVTGAGHYGHRILFHDGYLWITSGEREKFDPAQDMRSNLGKIVRLYEDGSVPKDNPFAEQGGVTAQIWTLGHRNPLGIASDSSGRIWETEMGPAGGDEFNLITRGANYGYPIVSNGDHYDGRPIPDHDTRPEFKAPVIWWTPVISPSSLIFYSGNEFPEWKGNAFIGGLSSKSLVRVEVNGEQAREAERFDMGNRIRAVKQGPEGALWLLEDEKNGSGGRLLKLTKP